MAEEKKKEKKFLDQIFSAFSFKNQCCGTRVDAERVELNVGPKISDNPVALK